MHMYAARSSDENVIDILVHQSMYQYCVSYFFLYYMHDVDAILIHKLK